MSQFCCTKDLKRGNRNRDNIDVCNSNTNGNSEASNGFVGLAGGNTQTGAGCETKASSIIPVKVKGRGKGRIIETYALLDNGSTATFCTEQLLEDLGVHGNKCELSLATIENENTKSESMVASLEVMNLEDTVMVEMPTVFCRKILSIPLGGISKQADVDQWPYLRGIKLPKKLNQIFAFCVEC